MRDIPKIPRLKGRNAIPVASGPKPSTSWMYCTTRKNIDRFAPMISAIEASAPTRRRLRTRCGCTIGCGCRVSVRASSRSSAAPRTNPPTVRTEPQPCSGAPMSAQTRETAPMVALAAPTRSKRPERRGVSSTKRPTRSRTTRPSGTLMKSVQRHDPTSVSRPPRMRPMDAPPEETAPKRAKARLRAASSGALVVRRASTLGAARAAPTPWRARVATSCPGVWANPPSAEATVKIARPAWKARRRPKTSPSRPPRSSRPPKARV